MYFLLLTCFFLSLVFQVCEVGMIGKEEKGSGGCRSRFEDLVHLVQGDKWTLQAHRNLEAEEANGEAVDSGDGRVVELMQSMRGCSRMAILWSCVKGDGSVASETATRTTLRLPAFGATGSGGRIVLIARSDGLLT